MPQGNEYRNGLHPGNGGESGFHFVQQVLPLFNMAEDRREPKDGGADIVDGVERQGKDGNALGMGKARQRLRSSLG